ncbi:uncharacterized protein LOC142229845 isoform X2 [Haematobia irritans]|uniref:uncharacterized protein LOC142229845 isoform X2 n=1 Tax=Haematobia irritans TaxID=7368 RepID=UPI003F4FBFD5
MPPSAEVDRHKFNKKCGEILISIKNNAKNVYSFNCWFCDSMYIEIAKFTSHLEKEHKEQLQKDGSQSECRPVTACDSSLTDIKEEDCIFGDIEFQSHEEQQHQISLLRSSNKDPLNIMKTEAITDNKSTTMVKEECVLQEPECPIPENINESNGEGEVQNYSEEDICENSDSDESVGSDDSNSPLIVHNFIKSKENVIFLIEEYKKQPQLWNQKYPQFALKKKHDKYLEEIKSELKKKINVPLTCTLISAVITYLCRKYRQDLRRIKLTEFHEETTDVKNPPAWFFPYLEFMKPVVLKTLSKTLNSSRRPNMEPKQVIDLLAIYKRFPHLWNTNLIEYVCKNKRLEALQQLQKVVKTEMNQEMSENLLKNNILFFHNHFTKIKRSIVIEAKEPKDDIYYEHMTFLNDHVGPFKCDDCGQVFKSPLAFKIHKSQHNGSAAIICSLCNKEYNTSGPYIAHARRHCEDLSEECNQCGKKFLMVSDLKIHQRSHSGIQPYCCEICGVSFRHSTSLNVHRRRHEKQYLHICPICSKGFYKKDRMNDHIRSHNNIREFACKLCDKAFKTRKTLKQHEVIHNDSRNHVCNLCGKAFKLKVGLLQHMRTHGGHV